MCQSEVHTYRILAQKKKKKKMPSVQITICDHVNVPLVFIMTGSPLRPDTSK